MKPAGIEKEEVMLMLTQMNNQLDQLEADLHSSTDEFQEDWYESQLNRLQTCGNKLTALEGKIADMDRNGHEVRLNYKAKKITTLEIGF